MGTSSEKVLWRRRKVPFLTTMCVFDLRSCVLDVTDEWIFSFPSHATMIRFFDSCSWMRITFSCPLTTK